VTHHDAPGGGEHGGKVDLDAAPLVGLAFGGARCRRRARWRAPAEAQIRLPAVPLCAAADEAAPDAIAEDRARRRVGDRRPQHEAGDRIVAILDADGKTRSIGPQHAGERAEQDRRLEESDAQVGRQFA